MEFLDGVGESRYCRLLENVSKPVPLSEALHVHLIDLLRQYYFAAQQLMAHFRQLLYYWRSKGGKAELDFLCEFTGRIYPLEVKAGINPRSKSLGSYNIQFSPPVLARSTLLNFKKDGQILNLSLYALSLLPELVTQAGH
jgi:predicted AAA+ superfamily ATPase